ncbi:MAG: hypothetical protein WA971_10560 [Microbacterium sp.]
MNTRSSLDRRTVLKGAAWSVPVVAAAVAVPAYATTGGCGDCEDYTVVFDQMTCRGTEGGGKREQILTTFLIKDTCGNVISAAGATAVVTASPMPFGWIGADATGQFTDHKDGSVTIAGNNQTYIGITGKYEVDTMLSFEVTLASGCVVTAAGAGALFLPHGVLPCP